MTTPFYHDGRSRDAIMEEAIAAWNTRVHPPKAQQPREDVVERVATVLAPFVCRPVHNGDCDDIAAGQSHARYVARTAIAAMQESRDAED